MKRLMIAAVAALVSIAAWASEAPVKQDPVDKPTGTTVQDCLDTLSGLQNLDGHWVVLNDGKDSKLISYVFENDTLRGILQDDIAALNVVAQRQQKIEQDIYREIAGTNVIIEPGSKDVLKYNQRVFDSKQKPCTAILKRFNIKDLKLGKNEIPGTVLGALDKILDK